MNTDNKKTYRPIEELPYEFIFYKKTHIICQRYFDIRRYNPACLGSPELDILMDNLVGMNLKTATGMGIIPFFLKKQAIDSLWNNYRPHYDPPHVNVGRDNFEKDDKFTLEIRVNKKTVAKSGFSGNYFPMDVRHQVNIKEIIPDITAEIRYFMSLNTYGDDTSLHTNEYYLTEEYALTQ